MTGPDEKEPKGPEQDTPETEQDTVSGVTESGTDTSPSEDVSDASSQDPSLEPDDDPSAFEAGWDQKEAVIPEPGSSSVHKDASSLAADDASDDVPGDASSDASDETSEDDPGYDPADGLDDVTPAMPLDAVGEPSDDEESEASDVPASAGGGGDGGDDDDDVYADEDDDDDLDGKDGDEDDEEEGENEMTLLDHLTELRVRLVRCVIAAGVGFLLCYGFSKQLFNLLMEPLVQVLPPESSLIYTSLPEAFFTYIKVSIVAGVFVASPYLFYQIWKFVAPGLYSEEKKYMLPIAFLSALFFVVGSMFGYFVVFPFGFQFFMDFATDVIKPMPTLNEYLGFSLKLLFAFGVIFELPLFIFFLAKLGIVNHVMLRKFRKYAFLCSFILSAILTPPDVISQLFMSGPLMVLYEISIYVAQAFGKKPREEDEDEEEGDEEEAETGDAETGDLQEGDADKPDA